MKVSIFKLHCEIKVYFLNREITYFNYLMYFLMKKYDEMEMTCQSKALSGIH